MTWRVPVKLPEPVWVSQEPPPRSVRIVRHDSVAYGGLLTYCRARLTCPANKIWVPRSIWLRVIASANVGTRQPYLSIADLNGLAGSLGMYYCATTLTQESSGSGYYTWALGASHIATLNGGVEPWEVNAMPSMLMTDGFILHPDIQNEIAGDSYIVNAIIDEYDSGT